MEPLPLAPSEASITATIDADLTEKTLEILTNEETKTGQRSRRSSGYASASNSPVNKRAAAQVACLSEEEAVKSDETAAETAAAPVVSATAIGAYRADSTFDSTKEMTLERMSLYEVTLRWMFDAEVTPPPPPVTQSDLLTGELSENLLCKRAGSEIEVIEQINSPDCMSISSVAIVQDERIVRIYFHLFSQRHMGLNSTNELPSHIDFLQVPANPEGSQLTDDVQREHAYTPILQHTSHEPPTFMPR